jgi:hypothetical protein
MTCVADVFLEHLVKRQKDSASRMKSIGFFLLALLVEILLMAANLFFPDYSIVLFPLMILAGWGYIMLSKRMHVEYEYILTNGEMDIDRILGQTRRKRMISVDCRQFDILAPMTKEFEREYTSKTLTKKLDYSSGPRAENRIFAIFNGKDGARTLLVFEPNEKILLALKSLLRSKIKGL